MKNLIRGIAVLLTAVFLCFNIYYELAPGITVAPEQKFVFAAIFAVLLRAALFCGVPDNTRPIRRRLYMLALFLYYIWVLLNVLFFDNAFGRGFGHTSLDMVNLEPLRTVKNYLLAYGYGNISLRLVVLNLAGNLIAFADGRVPARTVPLAEKHFLLHGVARAEHHGGGGAAGVHRNGLVRCG